MDGYFRRLLTEKTRCMLVTTLLEIDFYLIIVPMNQCYKTHHFLSFSRLGDFLIEVECLVHKYNVIEDMSWKTDDLDIDTANQIASVFEQLYLRKNYSFYSSRSL